MPRKGTQGPKQDYKFLGVLYPDSESYDYFQVVAKLKQYFGRWAIMVHDQDKDDKGEYKKTHVHWVGVHMTEEGKNSPVSLDAVAGALGVQSRDIEYCKSEKGAIRYLCHADDEDKHQYSPEDIQTNANIWKFFRDRKAVHDSRRIYDYIMEQNPVTLAEVLDWIFQEGLYAEFRRGFAVWDSLLREIRR